MFKKKFILSALLVASVAGLASCAKEPEFEQNTGSFTAPEETMYIVGSNWNSWTPGTIAEANPSCKFVRSTENPNIYVYDVVVTTEMAAGYVGFKFISGPSWGVQFGMEDLDWAECNDAFKALFPGKDEHSWKEGTTNRSNVEVTAVGTYHIEYNPYNFDSEALNDTTYSNKFVIDFTPAA